MKLTYSTLHKTHRLVTPWDTMEIAELGNREANIVLLDLVSAQLKRMSDILFPPFTCVRVGEDFIINAISPATRTSASARIQLVGVECALQHHFETRSLMEEHWHSPFGSHPTSLYMPN